MVLKLANKDYTSKEGITNSSYDLKSIKPNELQALQMGIQLMIDNSANIIQYSEAKQKQMYVNAMIQNNPTETIENIKKSIDENWNELKQQIMDNHSTYENILKRLQNPVQ